MKFLYTTCGTQFQVSDEDEIFLAGFSWRFDGRYIVGSGGKFANQYIHRVIAERASLDFPDDIDHIDGNPLNNQRDNLRPATRAENAANRKSINKSGYKGVTWNKKMQKWQAKIKVNEKCIHLGYYDYAEQAHLYYCIAAIKHFGKFARFE